MSCNQLSSRIVLASIFVIILFHSAPSVALVAPLSSFRSTSYTLNSYRHHNHNILQLAPQQLGEFEAISFANDEEGRPITRDQRRVWLYDFVTSATQQQKSCEKQIPYQEAWDMQKKLVDYQLTRIGKRPRDPPLYDQFVPMNLDNDNDNTQSLAGCDSIIMLQHDPVYTLGTASDPAFIHGYDDSESNNINGDSIPIVRIERGGEVTYHGPGQLTVYPILDLRGYKQDIHWYMRALEEVILLALEKSGVKGVSFLYVFITYCIVLSIIQSYILTIIRIHIIGYKGR